MDLQEALNQRYRFEVVPDPDGGYVVRFPDLPGCLTQVDDLSDVGRMADEIRTLWIEAAFALEQATPSPGSGEPKWSGVDEGRIRLSSEDLAMIHDWIEHPPPVNEKLKAAIAALAENQ